MLNGNKTDALSENDEQGKKFPSHYSYPTLHWKSQVEQ